MSVELQPQELGFKRPFNHEVTEILKITNNNSGPVAFKVKTTAPKQYCVRPNSGLVKPHESVNVQVLLQAMKEDPPLDARCRDKFLVQSVAVESTDESSVPAVWSNIEKTAKSSIQEQKIRVQFLPAGADSTPAAAAAGVLNTPSQSQSRHSLTTTDEPPAYSSPTQTYGSPAPASDAKSSTGSARSAAASTAESAQAGLAGAATTISNAIPKNQDELQAQLDAARAKISELTTQLSDPQVRQRKVAEAQEKVQTIVQQSQESGVPLHIVAALCLVSFLIAWAFF